MKQAHAEASSRGCQLADVNRLVVVTSAGDFVTLLQTQYSIIMQQTGPLPDIQATTFSFLKNFF